MPQRPRSESYGPYTENRLFSAFNDLSERTFAEYHRLAGEPGNWPKDRWPHTIRRMMYLAESTSYSLRLVASWAMSLPALSLCRDRYEQTIRFSYLAHQEDDDEWNNFLYDALRKKNQLGRRIAADPTTRKYYENLVGPLDQWETEIWDKPARAKFEKWKSLSLETMAKKRDRLVCRRASASLATSQPLAVLYTSMYAEASSVAHSDFLALGMLHEHPQADQIILAPDPRSPILVALHCAMFDIIQCADCFAGFWKAGDTGNFEALWGEWQVTYEKLGL